MNGYFKPLRRKIGVLTLFMACIFFAGWIRSRVVADVILFQHPRDRWSVASVNNNTSFHYYQWSALSLAGEESGPSDPGWRYHHSTDLSRATKKWSNVIRSEQDRVWSFAGMTYAVRTAEEMGGIYQYIITIVIVPYWLFVVPLTLLSAWLLLGKPRAEKIGTNAALPKPASLT